ncbi:hypothetical protein [Streptomyces sp. NPDC086989]|uniref:hypothetical protein n=1 Tax=Streptomyces sp. NPDC086989 TaxID=3365764 RepID=UPI00381ACE4E
MAAPQEHSFASKPTTAQECQADYRPPAQAAQAAADARNQIGQLGTGQQHTHRS